MIGLGARGSWAGLTAGIVCLGVLEAVVVHFVAASVLPAWAAIAVDVTAGVLTAALVLAFASPLWSRVRLDRERLRVRFGWLAAIDIPLDRVRAAGLHRADALHPVTMGIDFDADSQTLFLVRSASSPLVRLDFTDELGARTQGWKRVRVRAVVLGTDQPEALLAQA